MLFPTGREVAPSAAREPQFTSAVDSRSPSWSWGEAILLLRHRASAPQTVRHCFESRTGRGAGSRNGFANQPQTRAFATNVRFTATSRLSRESPAAPQLASRRSPNRVPKILPMPHPPTRPTFLGPPSELPPYSQRFVRRRNNPAWSSRIIWRRDPLMRHGKNNPDRRRARTEDQMELRRQMLML